MSIVPFRKSQVASAIEPQGEALQPFLVSRALEVWCGWARENFCDRRLAQEISWQQLNSQMQRMETLLDDAVAVLKSMVEQGVCDSDKFTAALKEIGR